MRIILAATASIAMLSAAAAAQTKDEASKGVVAEGGGSGIFMDKRSPEEREACADGSLAPVRDQKEVDANSFYEGWPCKVADDNTPPKDCIAGDDRVVAEGGGSDILRARRSPEGSDQCADGIVASGGGSGI